MSRGGRIFRETIRYSKAGSGVDILMATQRSRETGFALNSKLGKGKGESILRNWERGNPRL